MVALQSSALEGQEINNLNNEASPSADSVAGSRELSVTMPNGVTIPVLEEHCEGRSLLVTPSFYFNYHSFLA